MNQGSKPTRFRGEITFIDAAHEASALRAWRRVAARDLGVRATQLPPEYDSMHAVLTDLFGGADAAPDTSATAYVVRGEGSSESALEEFAEAVRRHVCDGSTVKAFDGRRRVWTLSFTRGWAAWDAAPAKVG